MYKNNQGHQGVVTDAITPSDDRSTVNYTTMVVIKFESGYTGEYDIRNVRRGHFKDYGVPNSVGGFVYPREDLSNLKIYNMWNHMMHRCYNENTENYHNYGGRGVRVSERWKHLKNFEEDLVYLKGYREMIKNPDDYSLDKDSKFEGNMIYSKETCVLLEDREQAKYRRNVGPIVAISKRGERVLFENESEASRELGVERSNIWKVLNNKISQTGGYFFERP